MNFNDSLVVYSTRYMNHIDFPSVRYIAQNFKCRIKMTMNIIHSLNLNEYYCENNLLCAV